MRLSCRRRPRDRCNSRSRSGHGTLSRLGLPRHQGFFGRFSSCSGTRSLKAPSGISGSRLTMLWRSPSRRRCSPPQAGHDRRTRRSLTGHDRSLARSDRSYVSRSSGRRLRSDPDVRLLSEYSETGVSTRDSSLRQLSLVTAPSHRSCDLLLKATRGVTIALVSSRERKRRQPGLATDDPAFVGWHQLVRGIQGS